MGINNFLMKVEVSCEGGGGKAAVVITKLTPLHHPHTVFIILFVFLSHISHPRKIKIMPPFPILPSPFLPISHLVIPPTKFRKYKAPSALFASPLSLPLLPAMNKAGTSMAEAESEDPETAATLSTHHLTIPRGLSQAEFQDLIPSIREFHTYMVGPGQCSSLLAQRVNAPLPAVWSVVRRFDKPQTYKHFIKTCHVGDDFEMRVGCLRHVNVISGLPAATSTERLDILDEERHVTGFSIIGGEHRLRNYRSVTTVQEHKNDGGEIGSMVLESYVVDVPEGNTEGETRLFADTVVRLNLQKLASLTEGLAREGRRRR